MKNLNYLMDYILYSISDIQDYLEHILKNHGGKTSVRIYLDKLENKITFKIKIG